MAEHDNPLADVLNQLNGRKDGAPGGALSHPADSFPVLKAFQDYLDSERRKMRQRTTLAVAATLGACLAVLVLLVVPGMIFISGMYANQDRMRDSQVTMNENMYRLLETMAGIGERQNRPIPPPVVPANVARDLEAGMAGEVRRVIAEAGRDIQNEIASGQNVEFAKSSAMLLELQEQLRKMGESLGAPVAAPAMPAVAGAVAPPQTQTPAETVNPVRPSSDFPDLAARWEQRTQQPPQKEPPAQLPPGMYEIQPRPLTVVEPRPLTVLAPDQAASARVDATPLKLEFSNTAGPGAQPATLAIPAPDGSTVNWRLMIPGN